MPTPPWSYPRCSVKMLFSYTMRDLNTHPVSIVTSTSVLQLELGGCVVHRIRTTIVSVLTGAPGRTGLPSLPDRTSQPLASVYSILTDVLFGLYAL